MNGKRVLVIIGLVVLMMLLTASAVQAQMKFGYIDTQRIFASYQKAIDAQKRLEEERASMLRELQQMEEEIRTSQQALEQQSLLLSEEKKRQKEQEIQDMIMRYQRATQEKDQEFAKRQTEILKPVYDDINAAIRKIGDDEGYDFILDASALLDVKEQYDLTDKVLKALGVDVTSEKD